MTEKEANISIRFIANYVFNSTENYFTNIPKDLRQFLEHNDGTMTKIVDSLSADKLYEIEIKIKSV
jgi:hypothetical protein